MFGQWRRRLTESGTRVVVSDRLDDARHGAGNHASDAGERHDGKSPLERIRNLKPGKSHPFDDEAES